MFLVEIKRNWGHRAEIYMRPDGQFEGRIFRAESVTDGDPSNQEFEVCGVTETLLPLEEIVQEELGI